MTANEKQIGGDHYKRGDGGEEHWDRVRRLGLDYFQACITKYVERCWKKNGLQDLRKAQHFLEKYIELNAEVSELKVEISAVNNLSGTIDKISLVPLPPDATEEQVDAMIAESGCILRDYTPIVDDRGIKRTGYIGFVYEGGTAAADMYRCNSCREFFEIPVGGHPGEFHTACPGPAYVSQDG